jgi:hypothetical protein
VSTAPIKAPTPKCGICGLSANDLVSDGTDLETLEASQRLGSTATGWRCPHPDRCRRMMRGESLSDDRRFGDAEKYDDLDDAPDPPRVPYHEPPPQRRDDDPSTNGVK